MKVMVIPIVIGTLGTDIEVLVQNREDLEDHPNYSIVEIALNTKRRPRKFWRRGSPNLGQKTRSNNNQQKEENLQNCRLCCPG